MGDALKLGLGIVFSAAVCGICAYVLERQERYKVTGWTVMLGLVGAGAGTALGLLLVTAAGEVFPSLYEWGSRAAASPAKHGLLQNIWVLIVAQPVFPLTCFVSGLLGAGIIGLSRLPLGAAIPTIVIVPTGVNFLAVPHIAGGEHPLAPARATLVLASLLGVAVGYFIFSAKRNE